MENLLFFLATSLAMRINTQRKLQQQYIGTTGCSALLYAQQDDLNKVKTASGDDLYFHEHKSKGVSYGMILVEMQDDHDLVIATEMLISYIDKLRSPLSIMHRVGITKDIDWNTTESSTILDYWQDKKGADWKIKGYTNGRQLAVLYVRNIGQVDVKKQDQFLDSFHFGG